MGGRIGSMQGVRADKKPEKKTSTMVGWANSAVTSLTIEISIIWPYYKFMPDLGQILVN
jgi:hypothetical protein